MHQINLDLSLEEISKIEGGAGLDLTIRNGQVEKLNFKITEYKRFYTQAIRGKAALAAPTLLARICGTCSNAHILAAIKTLQNTFKINVINYSFDAFKKIPEKQPDKEIRGQVFADKIFFIRHNKISSFGNKVSFPGSGGFDLICRPSSQS